MQGDLLLLGTDQQLAIGKVPELEAEDSPGGPSIYDG
jgi:hypothetical protein